MLVEWQSLVKNSSLVKCRHTFSSTYPRRYADASLENRFLMAEINVIWSRLARISFVVRPFKALARPMDEGPPVIPNIVGSKQTFSESASNQPYEIVTQ